MELIFGYLAGLLTLINPCVLPILPIVLASSLQAGRHGPLMLAAGMSLAFVTLGLLVASIGHAIGLTEDRLAQVSATLMVAFGAVLLIPAFESRFAMATAGLAAGADNRMSRLDMTGGGGQFVGGMLLGAVWSPCVGPTLGGAIALASQGRDLAWAGAIMTSFALGVSSMIVALAYGTRAAIRARQGALRGLAERARPVLGLAFVVIGLALLLKLHHKLDAWLVDVLPYWFQDLSIMF